MPPRYAICARFLGVRAWFPRSVTPLVHHQDMTEQPATEGTAVELTDLACTLVIDACALTERLDGAAWADADALSAVDEAHQALLDLAAALPEGPVLDDVCGATALLRELRDRLERRPGPPERLAS